MDDTITKFLGIEDPSIRILAVKTTKSQRIVDLERIPYVHYCDACGSRMYSRGVYVRTVNHPIMQDGLQLTLRIHQRSWKCCNPACGDRETDHFSFVDRYRRNTNLSDLLIVEAFRDPTISASAIAKRFSVSDTHAITTFARYVDMKRRPLTEILCIDEVHVGISKKCNYALIIQDFLTGEPIDMVLSRREEVTLPYFTNIPLKERNRVKYLIMDMYRPYLAYVDKYFYHVRPVVDAFHVIQLINRYFLRYIRSVQRRLDQRDRAVHEQREQEFKRKLPFTHSKDYLLLKKYHWMLLKNQQDIHYYRQPRLNRQFGRMMNTFDYEEWLYRIEPNFREIRSLKEKYITFNQRYRDRPKEAKKGLRELIDTYRHCRFSMFHEIADTLEEFSGPIVDSFHLAVRTDKSGKHLSRLSNGPIESINRIPKDMKRIGRGYLNFEHLRNRFLFSQRKNARILGPPKSLNEIYLKIEPIRY